MCVCNLCSVYGDYHKRCVMLLLMMSKYAAHATTYSTYLCVCFERTSCGCPGQLVLAQQQQVSVCVCGCACGRRAKAEDRDEHAAGYEIGSNAHITTARRLKQIHSTHQLRETERWRRNGRINNNNNHHHYYAQIDSQTHARTFQHVILHHTLYGWGGRQNACGFNCDIQFTHICAKIIAHVVSLLVARRSSSPIAAAAESSPRVCVPFIRHATHSHSHICGHANAQCVRICANITRIVLALGPMRMHTIRV